MLGFGRGLGPRNRFLGEVSEGAVEAPSDRTPQMGPYHRSRGYRAEWRAREGRERGPTRSTGPPLVELHGVDGLARLILGLLQTLLELPVQHLALGLLGLELLLEELLPFRRLAAERGERLVQAQSRAMSRRCLVGDHSFQRGIDRQPAIATGAGDDEGRHAPTLPENRALRRV